MVNIHMRGLENIIQATQEIQNEINDIKPFKITHAETIELLENISGKVNEIKGQMTKIRKVAKEFHRLGFII